jgi:hypothetical protein
MVVPVVVTVDMRLDRLAAEQAFLVLEITVATGVPH